MNKPPAEMGYAMPAEWERHEATWLAFPRDPDTFPDLESIRGTFVEMIRRLLSGERVHIFVADPCEEDWIRRRLSDIGPNSGLVCHLEATADSWIRDTGAVFLKRRSDAEVALADFRFNAWGEKYPELLIDDRLPEVMEGLLGLPRFRADFVLEGGSIDVNGQGLCLTTEQCLLHPNRNPGLARQEIERRLQDWLGADEVVWLGEGIAENDTDGHVDDVARFVSPDTVLCAIEEDPADVNYKPLQDNLQRLRGFRDRRGRPLRIETVPMPEPIERQGRRLPASFVNFYLANACVLTPIFGGRNDAVAVDTLRRLFPGRTIAPLMARSAVVGSGAFHCLTQQQPRAGEGSVRRWGHPDGAVSGSNHPLSPSLPRVPSDG